MSLHWSRAWANNATSLSVALFDWEESLLGLRLTNYTRWGDGGRCLALGLVVLRVEFHWGMK